MDAYEALNAIDLYKEAFKYYLLETEVVFAIGDDEETRTNMSLEVRALIQYLRGHYTKSDLGYIPELHITATNRRNPKHKCYFSMTGKTYWPVFDDDALSKFLTYLLTKQEESCLVS